MHVCIYTLLQDKDLNIAQLEKTRKLFSHFKWPLAVEKLDKFQMNEAQMQLFDFYKKGWLIYIMTNAKSNSGI